MSEEETLFDYAPVLDKDSVPQRLARKRSHSSGDTDASERPQKLRKYNVSSKLKEVTDVQEGSGGEEVATTQRKAKQAAKEALLRPEKGQIIRKRSSRKSSTASQDVIAEAAEQVRKMYEELDQYQVLEEPYSEEPRPEIEMFDFISMIDPKRAKEMRKKRRHALDRGREVLRAHHEAGRPIEKIDEDTVREALDVIGQEMAATNEIQHADEAQNHAEEINADKSRDHAAEGSMEAVQLQAEDEIPFVLNKIPTEDGHFSNNVQFKRAPASPTRRSRRSRRS